MNHFYCMCSIKSGLVHQQCLVYIMFLTLTGQSELSLLKMERGIAQFAHTKTQPKHSSAPCVMCEREHQQGACFICYHENK
jgi:hypothetical protein